MSVTSFKSVGFIEIPQFMFLMIIFIVLYLWCIMCDARRERSGSMEERKEERAVGSPMRAAHVDTSRPREEWGVREACWAEAEGGRERSREILCVWKKGRMRVEWEGGGKEGRERSGACVC